MFASPREDRVRIGHRHLNVGRTATAGQPLVMFHGVTRRWQTFLPLAAGLASTWQITAPDFRGHGRSDRDGDRYRVIDYVRDGVDFLFQQFDEPVVVYGHSLGAMVAAAVAAEIPARVNALILEDPPFETMGSRILQTRLHSYFHGMQALAGSGKPVSELEHEVAQLPLIDPASGVVTRLGEVRDAAAIRFTAACLRQLDPAVLRPIVAGQWLEDYRRDDILRAIACPALLIQADMRAGGMLTDEDATQVRALLPDCTAVKLSGVGHLIHDQQPQQIIDLVRHFLKPLRVDREAPSYFTSQETSHEDC